jgi:hypothetical protein
MRKGTFSVQKANANSSAHNSRKNPPKYLIGLELGTKNYYELLKKDDDFILEAQAIYKEKIKQTMQKKQVENLIQETVLTLQPKQNENDVKDLFVKLNKKYGGHQLLEVSIHRDEGHFLKNGIAYYPTKNILQKDDGWYVCSDTNINKPKKNDFDKKVDISTFEKVYNYHAHAKFSMFDRKLGKSARMQKKDMSERIKFVSDELGLMFAPGENSRVKKSVNQIKDEHLAAAVAQTKVVAVTEEIAKLKTQNKSLHEQNKVLTDTNITLQDKVNSSYSKEQYGNMVTKAKEIMSRQKNQILVLQGKINNLEKTSETFYEVLETNELERKELQRQIDHLTLINDEYQKLSWDKMQETVTTNTTSTTYKELQ